MQVNQAKFDCVITQCHFFYCVTWTITDFHSFKLVKFQKITARDAERYVLLRHFFVEPALLYCRFTQSGMGFWTAPLIPYVKLDFEVPWCGVLFWS